MRVFVPGLAVLLLAQTAFGCANLTGSQGTKLGGQATKKIGINEVTKLKVALVENQNIDGATLETQLRGSTNFNDRSDYSVALMYLGRSKEAVELLKTLEAEKPGEYFIAANPGTALELSGQNEEALRWIKEGIHRNPDSHEGTEWLHAKILEAKIAQQKDANYFQKHSVLELDPEKMGSDLMIDGLHLTPLELGNAILHQLTERLKFVKPRDAAVASLLFDYAAIVAATRTLESARQILRMAGEYGYPSDKIEPLLALYDQQIAKRRHNQDLFSALVAVSVVGAGIAFLYFLYKRGIFVLSKRDLKQPL